MNLTSPYPAEISLADEGAKGYVLRASVNGARLYVYDLDRAGHSFCNKQCEKAWSPVLAPPSAKNLGDWATVRRDDGYLQWARHGRPVYYMIGDAPNNPKGDGKEGGKWHLLPYEK